MKKIVITGADGFIGKNLLVYLKHFGMNLDIQTITRVDDNNSIINKLRDSHVIYHLAGVNRPNSSDSFVKDNVEFTSFVFSARQNQNAFFKFVYASSAQAELPNPYGLSKRDSENILRTKNKNSAIQIYRLPGVFGKWARPNYNSVVATFCHNVANDIELCVNDPDAQLKLVYIDDIVKEFAAHIEGMAEFPSVDYRNPGNVYTTTVGDLARIIRSFKADRINHTVPQVGDSLVKNLHSTYLSYLRSSDFSYPLELRSDERGYLSEIIKGKGLGQIFMSTTKPGITRGNHFHHSKVEKFLVIKGRGRISFRNVLSDDVIDYDVDGTLLRIVDIPPGYSHSITNIGEEEMFTLFWSNEIFDPQNPDTYSLKV